MPFEIFAFPAIVFMLIGFFSGLTYGKKDN